MTEEVPWHEKWIRRHLWKKGEKIEPRKNRKRKQTKYANHMDDKGSPRKRKRKKRR